MIRKFLLGVVLLLVVSVMAAAGALAWAHWSIRNERAPLPAPSDIAAVPEGDWPVRLFAINTASQPMPRSSVLDPKLDPHPTEPYVMSHPSFVMQWSDGRLLLIDVGMTPGGARSFGKPLEALGMAGPIEPHGSAADALGDAASQVKGVIFTHLHDDHVGGILEMCARAGHQVPVFMTEAQDERPNYTTRGGRKLLNDSRLDVRRLEGASPLLPVPGFPGVYVIAAGGHTPGSQLVLAFVQTPEGPRRYLFTGDIVNNVDGVLANVPKPFWYRLLIVPEDEQRQGDLRRYLLGLHKTVDFALVVSHDQLHLKSLGLLGD